MSVPRRVAAAIILWAGVLWPGAAAAQIPADLELVLAVDGSASIDPAMLELELGGHAAAFRDPAVAAAVGGGYRGRIAVTLVRWSDPATLDVLVPWTLLADESSVRAFAAAIDAVPRRQSAGSTGIGAALLNAAALFRSSGVSAPRRVIDLVSNGYNNIGILPEVARDRLVADGIIINGLVILDDVAWLADYFADRVIGGPGAFVHRAEERSSFLHALLEKLKREIAQADVP